jgi:hypothetical protein
MASRRLRARTIDLVAGQTDLLMAGRLDAQGAAIAAADQYAADADDCLNRIETGVTFGFGLASTAAAHRFAAGRCSACQRRHHHRAGCSAGHPDRLRRRRTLWRAAPRRLELGPDAAGRKAHRPRLSDEPFEPMRFPQPALPFQLWACLRQLRRRDTGARQYHAEPDVWREARLVGAAAPESRRCWRCSPPRFQADNGNRRPTTGQRC